MNTDLIRYTVDEKTGVKLVNARQLHDYFESKYPFGTWIRKKIYKHKFKEGVDYEIFHYDKKNNEVKVNSVNSEHNTFRVECVLSFDAAKILAMAQNSDKADDFRNYLAKIEKKYDDLKKTSFKPAKTYTMSEVADFLQLEDYLGKIGRNRLYEILKEKEILDYKNKPIEKFVRRGYFDTSVVPYVVTESGLEWLSTSILVLKTKKSTAVASVNNTSDSDSQVVIAQMQSTITNLTNGMNLLKTGVNLIVETMLIAKSGSKTSEHQSHEVLEKMKIFLNSDNDQKALNP